MSRILYVCLRDAAQVAATKVAVTTIADMLLPDNVGKIPSKVLESGGIVTGISSPSELIKTRGTSLAAGYLVQPGDWDRPRSGRPDGAYALFRSDASTVELVTDSLASRTLWYAITPDMFIAATSQRAIVAMMQEFQFNSAVIPWMLTSGTLGPGLAWDKRIRHVPPATTITLDRRAWRVTESNERTGFVSNYNAAADVESRVTAALSHVIESVNVADAGWAITLSGGIDSRVILCLLKNKSGLRAVTWGLRTSLEDPMNDARIAQQLAGHFGLEHVYFATDLSDQPVERIFERFVANGEARVDHISGYADGFDLWGRMVSRGIHGIIRGDQAFGLKPVRTTLDARIRAGLTLWSDFSALPPAEHFGLSAPELPKWLLQRAGESLPTWRDRLQQEFRTPFVLGALSDLKLAYVEVINPLLSDSIIALIRTLPDELRSNKIALRRVASTMCPAIPFATSMAIQSADDILKTPRVIEFLRERLTGPMAGSAVPVDLAEYAVANLRLSTARPRTAGLRRVRQIAAASAPAWAKRLRSAAPKPPTIDHNRFAFRVYLLSQADHMFRSDAARLRRKD